MARASTSLISSGRSDPWTCRAVGVETLAHHHGWGALLPVADAHIVAAHEARNDFKGARGRHMAAAAADNDAEFGFIVDFVGDFRDVNSVVGSGDAGRLFCKPDLVLRRRASAFADVIGVVQADSEHFAGARDGRLKANLCERDAALAACGCGAGIGLSGVAGAQERDHCLGQMRGGGGKVDDRVTFYKADAAAMTFGERRELHETWVSRVMGGFC